MILAVGVGAISGLAAVLLVEHVSDLMKKETKNRVDKKTNWALVDTYRNLAKGYWTETNTVVVSGPKVPLYKE